MLRPLFTAIVALSVLCPLAPGTLSAQEAGGWNVSSANMSRAELRALLENLETAASSPAYSGRVAQSAAGEIQILRDRLEHGDFRIGDRIALQVVGEVSMPDTIVVEPGPVVRLPLAGTISLSGVLRSELQGHLTTEIARFIRDPVVDARALVGIAVLGSVGSPGFYQVPSEALLSEAIMVAGGPTAAADMASAKVLRAGVVLIDSTTVTLALTNGRTIDQLNIRAGDQIVIDALPPPSSGVSFFRTILLTTVTVGISLLLGTR